MHPLSPPPHPARPPSPPAPWSLCTGAFEEAAHVIELSATPQGPYTLEQLGWAEAVAEAVGD